MAVVNVGPGAVLFRFIRALGLICLRGPRLCWVRRTPEFDKELADTVVALGPAFVKAAQLLSTRADLLPPRFCRALARLYDNVRPDRVDATAVLAAAGLPTAGARLVGSGSIACVYRVRSADGRELAAKVRRPGIERSLNGDLAMLERLAWLLARVPRLRGVPVVEIVGQLTDSIRGQLDLAREADFLREIRQSMRSVPGVTVPAVETSTGDVLVMEFVPDLRRRRPDEFAEADRERAVVTALRAAYRMLFLDGVVHCDLHPGNLYFRTDGTIVIVDAGFTVRLTDSAREKFAAFFYCMSQGDGPACADIVLSTATSAPGADVAAFRAGMTELIEDAAGRPAAEFDLVSFATALFDLQRRYGFYADPQFVFPILSLLVLEGAVREFHPKVDFQREAKPFLTTALFECVLTAGMAAK
jgi:ubiquinone biosynthesis protein